MAPRKSSGRPPDRVVQVASRLAMEAGTEIHDERRRRRWPLRELGLRAGLTAAGIARLEAGHAGSLESYARIAVALGLRPELHLLNERQARTARAEDPVHAWMGDAEVAHLQARGFTVALDEPFQHYQFAGRGDVVAWSLERRTLLHVENRTGFPNLQEALGSYAAKRAYLAEGIAQRLRLRGGFASVTHVMVGLWSSEVQHVLRLRTATFRATCPDGAATFAEWWQGKPSTSGVRSTFVLLDPLNRTRSRRWVGLDDALKVEPRYRGYADALAAMGTSGDARHRDSERLGDLSSRLRTGAPTQR